MVANKSDPRKKETLLNIFPISHILLNPIFRFLNVQYFPYALYPFIWIMQSAHFRYYDESKLTATAASEEAFQSGFAQEVYIMDFSCS